MSATRIAIATCDGISVCDHLAHSTGFLFLNIENGAIISGAFRTRATDTCGNHATFVDLLKGAQAVICGGIGQGAADSLAAVGIEPIVIPGQGSIDDAVNGYLAGTLTVTDERVCLCH
jgi:predicted Fe-Mo cluster-binding NifX family protein